VALAACGVLEMAPAAALASSASVPTWTEQHPTASPPGRENAPMAYDAATGTVVLFGGQTSDIHFFADTWTWDGTTWTRQHPAARPHSRAAAPMAYDAATGTMLLFGGNHFRLLAGTWIWDGTTWTQQHPPVQPGKEPAAMVYDAATGSVVLLGENFSETWTWG